MSKIFQVFDTEHGISGLLVSIFLILVLHLVFKMGSFLWSLREKKDQATEESINNLATAVKENTEAITALDGHVQSLEGTFAEFPKFKKYVNRLFVAVKCLSGERWPEIQKEIMEENRIN